ncbi:MAG: coproporphyrinogen dehydrogenase HemZ [Eubacteriales bacterium]|nr:coproporphyrinogen dehydrogenase HemZ [Eubacteriales bacterium]
MKRGIIHLCKIQILFLDREFEHDVYELIKAFYPEAEFRISYEEEEEECGTVFRVERTEDGFQIKYKNEEHRGVVHAAVIEGQSADALISCISHNGKPGSAERTGRRTQEEMELRKQNKDAVKYALYRILVKMTGRTLPWGNLTGIRPAKLAMGLIESGMKNTEAAKEMRDRYLVSPQKAALAITIANREREILKNIDYENGYSLYIGIPFCPSICLYCSFSSYPLKQWKSKVDLYLDALCREIQAVSAMMKGKKLDTIYIGGGTPTTLEPEQLVRLLDSVGESFGYDGLEEFTVEAGRPDSITGEKLKAMCKFPVSRISVNPQTMNQVTLDIIGRKHTVEQTKNAFALARECGYDNINMDLIVGLPGEDISMVQNTLNEVRRLGPDSLTVHSLAVKRAARLNMFRDQYQEMTFENNQEIMDLTMRTAYEMEMGPYYLYRQKNMKGNFENVGYAKVDKAGIYNILIMEEKQPIIALGAGGSSKLVFERGKRIERVENVKDVSNYITRIDEMIERKRAGIEAWL